MHVLNAFQHFTIAYFDRSYSIDHQKYFEIHLFAVNSIGNRWYISIGTISKVHLISNKTCYNEIAQIGFISSLRDTGPVA